MSGPSKRLGERRSPSFRLLTAAALVVAAVVPTLGVGILTSIRLGTALHEDARLRAEQAAVTARALVARSTAELDRLTASYATWPRLAAAIAAGDLDTLRRDVLEFLVDQGQLSGAALVAGERFVAAGRPGLTATLLEFMASAPDGTSVRTLSDGVYVVSLAAVVDPSAAPGPSPVPSPTARLGFARRFDPEFAVELRGLTGFDVAIVDAAGQTTLATNPDAVAALGDLDRLPLAGEEAGFIVARVPLAVSGAPSGPPTGTDGTPATESEAPGELVLSTDLSAAQAAIAQLPALVAALAGTTTLAALALALWLSEVLRRRLAAVHAGLLAVADGQRPPPLSVSNDEPVDRLVEALGRLLAALERRERTVRRAFEAVAAVPVDRPPAEVAGTLLDAVDDIFELSWSAIVERDGTVVARSGRAPTELPEAVGAAGGRQGPTLPGVVVAELDPRPRSESSDPSSGLGPTGLGPTGLGPTGLGPTGRTATTGATSGTGPASSAGRRLVAVVDPAGLEALEEPAGPNGAESEPVATRSVEPGEPLVARLGRGEKPSPSSPPGWTAADEATLRLVALLIGSALEDAERYATAAERARRLDHLNQLQRQFLRSISHNLRTPLATIGLAVDDLADAVTGDPALVRRIQAIRSEAARLGRLVDQVLTLSRLEAGTIDLAAEPLVPADVVAAVWRELDVERAFRIDDRSGRQPVLLDRRALEQILWNLLDNAVRYAPSGTIEIRIDLRPTRAEGTRGLRAMTRMRVETRGGAGSLRGAGLAGELEIAVADEGPGVPTDERSRIFHRFVRGTTAGNQAGTGLGLSLARSLARLMGGDLAYLDRGPSAGACFALRVPVRTDRPAAEAGPREGTSAPEARRMPPQPETGSTPTAPSTSTASPAASPS